MKLPSNGEQSAETVLGELVGLVHLIRSVEAPSNDACLDHPAGQALYVVARSMDETAEHLHDAGRRRATFKATSCPPAVRESSVDSVRASLSHPAVICLSNITAQIISSFRTPFFDVLSSVYAANAKDQCCFILNEAQTYSSTFCSNNLPSTHDPPTPFSLIVIHSLVCRKNFSLNGK